MASVRVNTFPASEQKPNDKAMYTYSRKQKALSSEFSNLHSTTVE